MTVIMLLYLYGIEFFMLIYHINLLYFMICKWIVTQLDIGETGIIGQYVVYSELKI